MFPHPTSCAFIFNLFSVRATFQTTPKVVRKYSSSYIHHIQVHTSIMFIQFTFLISFVIICNFHLSIYLLVRFNQSGPFNWLNPFNQLSVLNTFSLFIQLN